MIAERAEKAHVYIRRGESGVSGRKSEVVGCSKTRSFIGFSAKLCASKRETERVEACARR